MLIGIDGNEANVEKKVGISEYSFELLKQFKECQISNVKFQIYLKNKPNNDLPKENENWTYRIVNPGKMWTQFGLPLDLYLHKPRPQIFFSPTHYSPRFCPVPTAISIMDLSYIYYPYMFKKSDFYQLKNWTAYSVKKASKVFTISHATKNDIIKTYKVSEDRVIVTYPGIKQVSSIKYKVLSMDKLREKYGVKGNYVLFVGTLQPRKNIVRLIEAFSRISSNVARINSNRLEGNSRNSGIELVIVGKKGWLYEDILNAPKKFNIVDKVKFLDFVPDQDLEAFYSNAICFVLPSLYEGFGLPVLEAMKYGCPVVTSNISSLPEAGGDAALYVNPEDVGDITSKIRELIENDKLKKEMIEKGYKQIKKFSWEKTAKQTLAVLEEIGKGK